MHCKRSAAVLPRWQTIFQEKSDKMEPESENSHSFSLKELERSNCSEGFCLNPTASFSQAADALAKRFVDCGDKEISVQHRPKDNTHGQHQKQQQQKDKQHRQSKKEKQSKNGKKRSSKQCQENLELDDATDSAKKRLSHPQQATEQQPSKTEIKQLTPAQRAYWQTQLPDGFDYYLGSFADAVIRSQPSDILEFCSEFTEELLRRRNNELAKLPTRSYLNKLYQKKFQIPGTWAKSCNVTSDCSTLMEGQERRDTGTSDHQLESDPPTIHSSDESHETQESNVTKHQGAAYRDEYMSSQQTWFTAKQTQSDQTIEGQTGSSRKSLDTDWKSPPGPASLEAIVSRDNSLERVKLSNSCSFGSLVEAEQVYNDSETACSVGTGNHKPDLTFVHMQAQAGAQFKPAEISKHDDTVNEKIAFLNQQNTLSEFPKLNCTDTNINMKLPEDPSTIQDASNSRLADNARDKMVKDLSRQGQNEKEADESLDSMKDENNYHISLGTIGGVPFHIALNSDTLHVTKGESEGDNHPKVMHLKDERAEKSPFQTEMKTNKNEETPPACCWSQHKEVLPNDAMSELVTPNYKSVKEIIKQFKLSESKGQTHDLKIQFYKPSENSKEALVLSTQNLSCPSEKQTNLTNESAKQSEILQKYATLNTSVRTELQNLLSKPKLNPELGTNSDETPSTSGTSVAKREKQNMHKSNDSFSAQNNASRFARAALHLWHSKVLEKRQGNSPNFWENYTCITNDEEINQEDLSFQNKTTNVIDEARPVPDMEKKEIGCHDHKGASEKNQEKNGQVSFKSKREALERVFKERVRTNSVSGNTAQNSELAPKIPIGQKDYANKIKKENERQQWNIKKSNKYQWEEKNDFELNKEALQRQWNVTNFQLYTWVEREEKNSTLEQGRKINENDKTLSKKVLSCINESRSRLIKTKLGSVYPDSNVASAKVFGVTTNSVARKQQIQRFEAPNKFPKKSLPFLSDLPKSKLVLSEKDHKSSEKETNLKSKDVLDMKSQSFRSLPATGAVRKETCDAQKSNSEEQKCSTVLRDDCHEVKSDAKVLQRTASSDIHEVITSSGQDTESDNVRVNVPGLISDLVKIKAGDVERSHNTVVSCVPETSIGDAKPETRNTKEDEADEKEKPLMQSADTKSNLRRQKLLPRLDPDVARVGAEIKTGFDVSNLAPRFDHGINMEIESCNSEATDIHKVFVTEAEYLEKETDLSESLCSKVDKRTRSETPSYSENFCSHTGTGEKDNVNAKEALTLAKAFVEGLEKVRGEVESVYRRQKILRFSQHDQFKRDLAKKSMHLSLSETKITRKAAMSENIGCDNKDASFVKEDFDNKPASSAQHGKNVIAFNHDTDTSGSESIISIPGLFDLSRPLLNDIARAILMICEMNEDKEYHTTPQACFRFVSDGVVFKIQPESMSPVQQASEVFREAGTSTVSVAVQESESLISQAISSIGDGGTNHEETGSIAREKFTNQVRRNVALRRALNQAIEEKVNDGKSVASSSETGTPSMNQLIPNTNEITPGNQNVSQDVVIENTSTTEKPCSVSKVSNTSLILNIQPSCSTENARKEVNKNGNNKRLEKARCGLSAVKDNKQRHRKRTKLEIRACSLDNTSKVTNRRHPKSNHFKLRRSSLISTNRIRDISNNSNNTRDDNQCVSTERGLTTKSAICNKHLVEGAKRLVKSNGMVMAHTQETKNELGGLKVSDDVRHLQNSHNNNLLCSERSPKLCTATPVLCTNQLSLTKCQVTNFDAGYQTSKQPPPTRWMFKTGGMLGISGQAQSWFTYELNEEDKSSISGKNIFNKNSCFESSRDLKNNIPKFENLVKGKFQAKHRRSLVDFKASKWPVGKQMSSPMQWNTFNSPTKVKQGDSLSTNNSGKECASTSQINRKHNLRPPSEENKSLSSTSPPSPLKCQSRIWRDPADRYTIIENRYRSPRETPTKEIQASSPIIDKNAKEVEIDSRNLRGKKKANVRGDQGTTGERNSRVMNNENASEMLHSSCKSAESKTVKDEPPYNLTKDFAASDIEAKNEWEVFLNSPVKSEKVSALLLAPPVTGSNKEKSREAITGHCNTKISDRPVSPEIARLDKENTDLSIYKSGKSSACFEFDDISTSYEVNNDQKCLGETSSDADKSVITTSTTTTNIDMSKEEIKQHTKSDSITSGSNTSKEESTVAKFGGKLTISTDTSSEETGASKPENTIIYFYNSKPGIVIRSPMQFDSGNKNCKVISYGEGKSVNEKVREANEKNIAIADTETTKQREEPRKHTQATCSLPSQNDLSRWFCRKAEKLYAEILVFSAGSENKVEHEIKNNMKTPEEKLNTAIDKHASHESNKEECRPPLINAQRRDSRKKSTDVPLSAENGHSKNDVNNKACSDKEELKKDGPISLNNITNIDAKENEPIVTENSHCLNCSDTTSSQKCPITRNRKSKKRNQKSRLTVRRSTWVSPLRKTSPQFAYEAKGGVVKSESENRRWPLQDMTIKGKKQDPLENTLVSKDKHSAPGAWLSWKKLFWWGSDEDSQLEKSKSQSSAPGRVIEFPFSLQEVAKDAFEDTEELTRVLTLEEPQKNVYVNTTFEKLNPRAISSAPYKMNNHQRRVYLNFDKNNGVTQQSTSPTRRLICEPEAFAGKRSKHERNQLILENGTSLDAVAYSVPSAASTGVITSLGLPLAGLRSEGMGRYDTKGKDFVDSLSPTADYTGTQSPCNGSIVVGSGEGTEQVTKTKKSALVDVEKQKTDSKTHKLIANRSQGKLADTLEIRTTPSQWEKLSGAGMGKDRFYEVGPKNRKSSLAGNDKLMTEVHRSLDDSVCKSKDRSPVWSRRPEVCKIGDSIVIGGSENWSGSARFSNRRKVRSSSTSVEKKIKPYNRRSINRNNSKTMCLQNHSISNYLLNTDFSDSSDSKILKSCIKIITIDTLNFKKNNEKLSQFTQENTRGKNICKYYLNEGFEECFMANSRSPNERKPEENAVSMLSLSINNNGHDALSNLNNNSNRDLWKSCDPCDRSFSPMFGNHSSPAIEHADRVLRSLEAPSCSSELDFCYDYRASVSRIFAERCQREKERRWLWPDACDRECTCNRVASRSEDRSRSSRLLCQTEETSRCLRGRVSKSEDRQCCCKNVGGDPLVDEDKDEGVNCEDVIVSPCPEKRDGRRVWNCRLLTKAKTDIEVCCEKDDEEEEEKEKEEEEEEEEEQENEEKESAAESDEEECPPECLANSPCAKVSSSSKRYGATKVINIVVVCNEEKVSRRKSKKKAKGSSTKCAKKAPGSQGVQTNTSIDQPCTPTNTPRSSKKSSREDEQGDSPHKRRCSTASGGREAEKMRHVSLSSLNSQAENQDFSARSLSGAGPLPMDILPPSDIGGSAEGDEYAKGSEAGSSRPPYQDTDITEHEGTYGVPLDGGGYLDPAYALGGGGEQEVVDATAQLPELVMIETANEFDPSIGPIAAVPPPRNQTPSFVAAPENQEYHTVQHVDTDTGEIRNMVVRRESLTVTSNQNLYGEESDSIAGAAIPKARRQGRKHFKGSVNDGALNEEEEDEEGEEGDENEVEETPAAVSLKDDLYKQ